VKTESEALKTQRVTLKDEHLAGNALVQALVDRIFLYESEVVQLRDQLKELLLESGFKYGDGMLAYACISSSEAPQVLIPDRCLTYVARKKITLRKLVESGAVTFNAKKLAGLFSGKEIEAMSTKGAPKAPSLTIKAQKNAPPPSVADALDQLVRDVRKSPVTTPTGQTTAPEAP
jgi:hypothetical protein